MTYSSIDQVFDKFNDLRVLVIGDIMIDSYLWGKTNRISPEAPVPVIEVSQREKRLGGAANVALNVQALGATPVLCGIVGTDINGNELFDLLGTDNLIKDGIVRSDDRITTIKHRIIAGAQHMLRVDEEATHDLSKREEKSLIEKIKLLLGECDVVIFEDYDKGVLTKKVIQETVTMANALKIPTVVDPKKKRFLAYKNTTLFKPNLKELREGLKVDFDKSDSMALEDAVATLKEKLQAEQTLITLSELGVYISGKDNINHHIPAHIRKIADVSGAGDTVISVAALALAAGLPSKAIAELANLAGGLVCESVGVVPVDKEKLRLEATAKSIQIC